MAPAPDNSYSVRVGGDASGPVVAGHDNRVETRHAPAGGASGAGDEPGNTPDTQTNTASDNASVYTVMNGELHIHQAEGTEGA
ncbi:hypothetical protein MMF93_11575 [Streptomyces tubbatahanensis]|uniref:Uncharacterized protein n=1 Tax=Streptomyces tubbatahanensis TaxID=2923272 RepID=A0ABY3XRN9_9ACTN|nr:hypothetical protein [Streptomyces tubbatahanensis]UNS97077.1 hypothetical protein MMF93_11575 [Streptomyces tubbatahanensis]